MTPRVRGRGRTVGFLAQREVTLHDPVFLGHQKKSYLNSSLQVSLGCAPPFALL